MIFDNWLDINSQDKHDINGVSDFVTSCSTFEKNFIHAWMFLVVLYFRIFVPKQIARLLHYRPCRPELKKDMCLSMKRTEDTRILSYMDESLRTSIKKTKKLFS